MKQLQHDSQITSQSLDVTRDSLCNWQWWLLSAAKKYYSAIVALILLCIFKLLMSVYTVPSIVLLRVE